MDAIRLHDFGDPDALVHEDVSNPEPAADELLVRVAAAGVNAIDWLVWRDVLTELVDESLPWIPGWDLSGEVTSVGADIDSFEAGDSVYGMSRLPGAGGTFAEYATVRPEEVTRKPEGLDHREAAGVPMVAQTAWHALFEAGEFEAGDRVLVHAAAGGVGHMAVQFAAAEGAHVVGTASGRNEQFLKDLGVSEVVNYREEQFEVVLDPVDLVIDGVGGDVLERSGEIVAEGGVVVTLPDEPPTALAEQFRQEHGIETRFFSVTSESDPAALERISTLLADRTVTPTISDVYPLAEAATALEESEAGHVRGKLVLDIA